MSSEDEIRAYTKIIGEKYLTKLKDISGNLDSEKFRQEYKKISSEAENELIKYLDSKNADSHLRTTILGDIFEKVLLPEFRKISEEKGRH